MVTTHLALFSFFGGMSLPEGEPPPPPVVVTAPRFGGGPFWKKYGYDEDYDEIRDQDSDEDLEEIRASLSPVKLFKADDAVNAAASAILRDEQPALVLDYQGIYEKILRSQRGIRKELKTEFAARRAFRAEIARKLRYEDAARLKKLQQDEDDMVIAMLYLMD